jgi:hypothetical protein
LSAFLFWQAARAWSAINILGIALTFASAQFLRGVENGESCGIPIWGVVPSNPVTGFFPGTTIHGLIASATTLLYNAVHLFLTSKMLGLNESIANSNHNVRKQALRFIIINFAGLFGMWFIYALAVYLELISTAVVIYVSGGVNGVDLRLPDICRSLPNGMTN